MASEMRPMVGQRPAYRKPNGLTVAWLLAWRHIKEAMHNRSTYVMAAFFILFPLGLVLLSLRPVLAAAPSDARTAQATSLISLYLLMAAIMPCTWAVGIAAGAFAAEKEQGSLIPLLATPASNVSIFAGKILGAVLPAMVMALVGVSFYPLEIAVLFGRETLRLIPPLYAALTLSLMPATALLCATIASMISARVRTEQIANQYASIIMTLIWVLLFIVAGGAAVVGLWVFGVGVFVIATAAVVLLFVSAATWRREEVMARQ